MYFAPIHGFLQIQNQILFMLTFYLLLHSFINLFHRNFQSYFVEYHIKYVNQNSHSLLIKFITHQCLIQEVSFIQYNLAFYTHNYFF